MNRRKFISTGTLAVGAIALGSNVIASSFDNDNFILEPLILESDNLIQLSKISYCYEHDGYLKRLIVKHKNPYALVFNNPTEGRMAIWKTANCCGLYYKDYFKWVKFDNTHFIYDPKIPTGKVLVVKKPCNEYNVLENKTLELGTAITYSLKERIWYGPGIYKDYDYKSNPKLTTEMIKNFQ